MKFGTDTLQGLLFREQARATQNSKMAAPKSKMSAQKCAFSFITQNALILSPIDILKLNINLGIVDILVPSTCLYPLRFLRYIIQKLVYTRKSENFVRLLLREHGFMKMLLS